MCVRYYLWFILTVHPRTLFTNFSILHLLGKIIKVLKQVEIKQEPVGSGSSSGAAIYATTVGGNIGSFTQMVSTRMKTSFYYIV